jgi:hypothetical protein
MSTEAFGSRRVTESLRAIQKYLDDGARIAGGVPPGQVVKLDLEPTPSTPGPRLRNVLWADNNSHVIEVGPGTTTLDVLASGTNLAKTAVFKLVSATSPSVFFETEEIDGATPTTFTATMTLVDPPAGSYHAFIVTETGQTFLLRNALAIDEPGESEPEPGLQLGEIEPNEVELPGGGEIEGAVLLLLRGRASDVSEVYFTDRRGVRKDWGDIEITPGEPVAAKGGRGQKHHQHRYKGAETVLLTFTVPDDEAPGTYILVAESTTLNSQDKLAFHVYVSGSSQAR